MARVDYDLSPLTRLSGLHLRGTVTRRFLISYAVPPEALEPLLPPDAELSLFEGQGWLSACFVNMRNLRPALVPEPLGMEFTYLIHRTRARLPFPDGRRREAVLVLEPNIDRPLFAAIGRASAGIRFHVRDIRLSEFPDGWRLVMRDGDETLFDAEIPRASVSTHLPPDSRFATAERADQALLGVSYGGQWDAGGGRLRLIAETHDPWDVLAARCVTRTNAYLEALRGSLSEADHVLTMSGIPHYFGIRVLEVAAPALDVAPALAG